MTARTERIEARVSREDAARIRRAAALEGTSTSAFVIDAASKRAERVIAEHSETIVPAEYFDRLLAALDQPDEIAPALARGALTARRRVRRR